tara:strand:+ start:9478 stop:10512 length:1035 start_codon:yes stop_codon:yes gene_type:complete
MNSRGQFVMAVDVGGTNTRVAIASQGETEQQFTERIAITSFQALHTLLDESVGKFGGWANIAQCALGFAGPVLEREHATVVNWPGVPSITRGELANWMNRPAPTGPVCTFFNDMEMTALGVLFADPGQSIHALEANPPAAAESGTRLVIAAGTGLGSIAIRAGDAADDPLERLIPSELGHGEAATRTAEQRQIVDYLFARDGRAPFWEELVSGRGLENLYAGVTHLANGKSESLSASEIATTAGASPDGAAGVSLRVFYEFLGQFAQALALVFSPVGGIFFAGDNTRKNLDFLTRAFDLPAWVRFHATRHDLLARYPIYAVDADLNLVGCLGWMRARGERQTRR